MSNSRKLVIPGGTGFLGRVLGRWFRDRDWDVVVLSRRPGAGENGIRTVRWDGVTSGDWAAELEHATALVNLAGRSVDCRYHARNRRAIMNSRIQSTRVLAEAISRCDNPPPVWLNASTATIYKHSIDTPMDELTGEIGPHPDANDAFSVEVATAWEQEFDRADAPRTRKVALRAAMVLGTKPGTVYCVLRRLTRLRLGGRMAHGRQYMSWIHETDFCRAVQWLIDHDELSGPVNIAAPHPLPNAELMRLFRRTHGVRIGLPATKWMLEIGAFVLRTETELILKSRRVVPRRLQDSGFDFRYPQLEQALHACRADTSSSNGEP